MYCAFLFTLRLGILIFITFFKDIFSSISVTYKLRFSLHESTLYD